MIKLMVSNENTTAEGSRVSGVNQKSGGANDNIFDSFNYKVESGRNTKNYKSNNQVIETLKEQLIYPT
jgi:hypothetical protein